MLQNDAHSYFSTIRNIYYITSKVLQIDAKKVEIVEIQDEKCGGEVNGSQSDFKSKADTRWSDNKSVKKESDASDKDKKSDNKVNIKKEPSE